MSNNYLENDIAELKLSKSIVKVLKDNAIFKIDELWTKKRVFLKSLGLSDKEIKEIVIKLELIGLDLKKKEIKYKTVKVTIIVTILLFLFKNIILIIDKAMFYFHLHFLQF